MENEHFNNSFQPNQTPLPPKKVLNKKLILSTLGLIIILIIAFSVSANKKTQEKINSEEIKSVVTLTDENFNNWQTHINKEYGFEIKYPKNLKLESDSSNNFREIPDGPGAFWQNLSKTSWQTRLSNFNKYKVGDNCLTREERDFPSSDNKECKIISLNPYAYKVIANYFAPGYETSEYATGIFLPLNDFEVRMTFVGELSDENALGIVNTFKIIPK